MRPSLARKPKRGAIVRLTAPQALLQVHLRELGIETVPEFRFCLERKFRFDLYSNNLRMGFECDGGQFSGGHMRGKALEKQYSKDRLAQLKGYRIMRFTNREVLSGEAKQWMQDWLAG
jgi:very-short-patch-repair endonuclease